MFNIFWNTENEQQIHEPYLLTIWLLSPFWKHNDMLSAFVIYISFHIHLSLSHLLGQTSVPMQNVC